MRGQAALKMSIDYIYIIFNNNDILYLIRVLHLCLNKL
jgi:hypothetical protein